ncbi:MAG: serine protein kinase [Candidatus Dadabacteria bacterium]|nr:MAG: serine protein kinase [Candidatus Dadabacteria bacterium]
MSGNDGLSIDDLTEILHRDDGAIRGIKEFTPRNSADQEHLLENDSPHSSASFGAQSFQCREEGKKILEALSPEETRERYEKLTWEGSFAEYLGIVVQNPAVTQNAWQRIVAMIEYFGISESEEGVPHYHIFDDPFNNGKDAVFGMDVQLNELVNILRAASMGLGPQNRIILLHGPVGTAKSTIVRLLKRGLEEYSKSEEGALYTFGFKVGKDHPEYDPNDPNKIRWCPMNEEPLHLVPPEERGLLALKLNSSSANGDFEIKIEQDLCPHCRQEFNELMEEYEGDWRKVLEHVRVRRIVLSESDRVGIGSFQPKDEKNQDSTELSGDINYRKIAVYGSDSDPRAFNFDGEFNVANRGLLEFIEVLKLDTAFLYDLLGATQEHSIKPKKFAQTDIDEVIIAHTNEPEYLRLVSDKKMEAFRDRTIKIDIPYNLSVRNEQKIYEKTFKHLRDRIAPHTLELASMWAVLTRLEEPEKSAVTLTEKMRLYNGEEVSGFSEDDLERLRQQSHREGLFGISPRYVQDTISMALMRHRELTPMRLLGELERGLKNNSLIDNEKDRERYRKLISIVLREYETIIRREVQEAVAADTERLEALCSNYVENVRAYVESREGKRDSMGLLPNESLMRSVEEYLDVPEGRKDDFRKELLNHVRALEEKGKRFTYDSSERLKKALCEKIFDDQKDALVLLRRKSAQSDPTLAKEVERIVSYLVKHHGYTESSAEEVLKIATDLFAD